MNRAATAPKFIPDSLSRDSPGLSPRRRGPADWLVWQLADSAFPTGGFAHSGGIEAAHQHRAVSGGAEFADFLRAALTQLVCGSLPFVHAAFAAQSAFADVDRACDAFLSNHVANRASRLQGRALLSTAARTFSSSALGRFRDEVLEAQLPSHVTSVFGRVASSLELEADTTSRLFVFTQLRGWISAAVRLNIVGPLEGQRLQHELVEDAERTAARFEDIAVEHAAQTVPLFDLWQGAQDRLYSRLFQT